MSTTKPYSQPIEVDVQEISQYNLLRERAANLKKRDPNHRGQFIPLLKNEGEVTVVANYAFIIYEYLELNGFRGDVNYNQMKAFAKKYHTWLEYLYNDQPPVRDKVSEWTRERIQLSEMAMYRGNTNKYNKNTYH